MNMKVAVCNISKVKLNKLRKTYLIIQYVYLRSHFTLKVFVRVWFVYVWLVCQGYDARYIRIGFDGMEGGNFNK
jgi:hypothetical protein